MNRADVDRILEQSAGTWSETAELAEQLKEAMTALEEIAALDDPALRTFDEMSSALGRTATIARRILSRWEAP